MRSDCEDRATLGGGRWCIVVTMLVLLAALPAASNRDQPAEGPGESPQDDKITITVVYDNNPGDGDLEAAWGFACVIEGLPRTVLFDTGGDGRILLANMRKLDVAPGGIDAVVLSHIHGDHVGGLDAFLRQNGDVTVFLPAAFPQSFKGAVRKAAAEVVECEKAAPVCAGASTTAVLGDGIKEQGLYVRTREGTVVITGCAHPGVVRMAAAAEDDSQSPIHAVLGGFHMSGASRAEIERVIEGFRRLGVKRAGPCHCSGDRTRKMMREAYGDDYIDLNVGASVSFPKPKPQEPTAE